MTSPPQLPTARVFLIRRLTSPDAANLFSPRDVHFGDYKFVYIVPPKTAAIPISPGFAPRPGNGVSTVTGEIRLAVTLGHDIYTNR